LSTGSGQSSQTVALLRSRAKGTLLAAILVGILLVVGNVVLELRLGSQ